MSKVKFRTNTGIAQYPWLQPGRPDTAFDAEGKYKVQLRLSEEDAKDVLDVIKQVKSDSFGPKDKVRLPFDRDEETGEIVIKTQSKYIPAYVDATGKTIPNDQVPSMFGGSRLRIMGYVDPYTSAGSKGISLRLIAVQIIEPVSSQGGGDFFDSVEGGFTVSGASNATTKEEELAEDDFNF